MPLTLTDAQIDTIKAQLFLFQSPMPTLPKPTAKGMDLALRLDPIGMDPRWVDVSIGVVDFTASRLNPDIWLQKEEMPWRMGSTGKIAALLAAVQLRDDVRKVKATGLVSAPADFDELFATIWSKSKDSGVRAIANPAGSPRISTLFDLSKPVPDFIGADVALDKQKLSDIGDRDMKWAEAPSLSVWERLFLMVAESDNVAASSCISEIGVDYMVAVQQGYGLFDTARGMHMLLGGEYAGVSTKTKVNTTSGAPTFRKIIDRQTTLVTDLFIDKDTGERSYLSSQAASVSALTAYMIALIQDKFIDQAACDTMRSLMPDTSSVTTKSLIYDGVKAVPGVTITRAHTKLGILGTLRCEFNYLEASGLKYAVMAMGIVPKTVGTRTFSEKQQGENLGARIHSALMAP